MKFKIFVLSLALILVSVFTLYCEEKPVCPFCATYTGPFSISFSVAQTGCGTCNYEVVYKMCIVESVILIDYISADATNAPCCFGTAANDPIVSGFILDAAGQAIRNNHQSLDIYTPSNCWRWKGTLGPGGIHSAVLLKCEDEVDNCCIFKGTAFVLVEGSEDCFFSTECLPLCD